MKPGTDDDSIAEFLSGEEWPYHSRSKLDREGVRAQLANGYFESNDSQSFMIETENSVMIGIMRLFDIEDIGDGSPMFDIKISSVHRSKGVGCMAVKWLTDYVFNTWPQQNRFEATTRVDNIAMRKVFVKNGFVREGHYRQAWPGEGSMKYDAVQYAILRHDWLLGSTTKINWDEV